MSKMTPNPISHQKFPSQITQAVYNKAQKVNFVHLFRMNPFQFTFFI